MCVREREGKTERARAYAKDLVWFVADMTGKRGVGEWAGERGGGRKNGEK